MLRLARFIGGPSNYYIHYSSRFSFSMPMERPFVFDTKVERSFLIKKSQGTNAVLKS